ncbi:RNA-binding domain-containing protein [Enterobacter bugandensis]|uniref:RNA-binding domain-containing protein n=1 Tax=Enterobacter bugandensis TaxID=881260 RepID=UPI003EF1DFB5
MIESTTITSLEHLAESREIECKQAAGRDGNGAVPDDLWPTYSAMANTNGGLILLGVKEKNGTFTASGINDIERVKKDLFNTLNNPQKISLNLISDEDVTVIKIDNKNILQINVPQANRKQRPVYLNSNPMTGTYLRLHEGDRKCTNDTVKIMLAEQMTDTLDDRIFEGYGIDDLDKNSIQIFRTLLATSKPNHVWLEHDDFSFIKAIKGWRKDRKTGIEGLTLAGILMFGKWEVIQEALPQYFIEYQEQDDSNRWVDRIVPDGTWTGNIFEFYRKVYRKLTEDLKIPFMVSNGLRTDDTPVHIAIREALVNTLVHADYNGHSPIKIVKFKSMFSFRNPGTMRVPFSIAKSGGESDCRNKNIHQMFLLIGLGERAGSGLPKIFSGWKTQHWSEPELKENFEIGNTTLELKTENIIPQSTISKIKEICGDRFDSLTELERLILATASEKKIVSHEEIRELTVYDTRKISLSLSKLVRLNFLKSDGVQKSKRYFLPSYTPVSPESIKGYELLKLGFIHPPEDFKYDGDLSESSVKLTQKISPPATRKQCCDHILSLSFLGELLEKGLKDAYLEINTIHAVISSRPADFPEKLDSEVYTQESHDSSNKLNSNLSTEHGTELSTDHGAELSTEHNTELSTEHGAELSTEHTTELSTEHGAELSTEHTTELSTEHGAELSTEHTTELSTELSTEHTTELSTELATDHSTELSAKRNDSGIQKVKRVLKNTTEIDVKLFEKYKTLSPEKLLSLLTKTEKELEDLERSYESITCEETGKPQTLYQMIRGEPFIYDIPNPDEKIHTYGEYWKVYQEVVWQELMDLAEVVRTGSKRNQKKSSLMRLIIMLSLRGYLSVRDYSELLGRNPNSLRRDYLTPLVRDGLLILAYPTKPTHALQGYKSNIFKLRADLSKYDE